MNVTIPIRLGRGQNDREHWRARHRRVKTEKEAVLWMLQGKERPSPPLLVTLTRIAPSNGLDDDGLVGSMKSCRDAVAFWLGVDDRHRDLVRYECAQERGPWAVRIEVQPMPEAAESETA